MTAISAIKLVGGTGSPYTRKMLALLRYRHIPHQIIWGVPKEELAKLGVEPPKIELLPTFILPDAEGQLRAVCDSTPIIRRLEAEHRERSVIPAHPAIQFIDYLLEDFADEWCTKYMFHYRWHPQEDADNAGTLLPLLTKFTLSNEQAMQFKQYVTKRQIDRLYVVGSNDTTAPIIEASYKRLLTALERHFEQQPFLFGRRPSAADFALYGQLTQLIGFDPTPRQIAHSISPRTVAYSTLLEDQSGHQPQVQDWNTPENLPATIKAILEELGRVYVPALIANAKALEAGEKTWQTEIDGAQWTQNTFPYQAKCLGWIRDEHQNLNKTDRQSVEEILQHTGCEKLFSQ